MSDLEADPFDQAELSRKRSRRDDDKADNPSDSKVHSANHAPLENVDNPSDSSAHSANPAPLHKVLYFGSYNAFMSPDHLQLIFEQHFDRLLELLPVDCLDLAFLGVSRKTTTQQVLNIYEVKTPLEEIKLFEKVMTLVEKCPIRALHFQRMTISETMFKKCWDYAWFEKLETLSLLSMDSYTFNSQISRFKSLRRLEASILLLLYAQNTLETMTNLRTIVAYYANDGQRYVDVDATPKQEKLIFASKEIEFLKLELWRGHKPVPKQFGAYSRLERGGLNLVDGPAMRAMAPNVPLTGEALWVHERWGTNYIQEWFQCKEKCKVAILDTGIDIAHPAFSNGTIVDVTSTVPGEYGWWDGNGHGTHCAGVIVGKGFGIAENHCELYVCKVLPNGNGAADVKWVIDGLKWADAKGCEIISMSLGGPGYSKELHEVVRELVSKGRILVCAAGNDGKRDTRTVGQPANFGDSVCVGSHNKDGEVSSFSAIGQHVDILAPGEDIMSSIPAFASVSSLYGSSTGTSMATPHVTGLCAMILSLKKSYGFQEAINTLVMKRILRYMAGGGDHSSSRGHGPLLPAKWINMCYEDVDADYKSSVVQQNFWKRFYKASTM